MSNHQSPLTYVHLPCADGLCALIILQETFQNLEIAPVAHFSSMPKCDTEERTIYYVDYSPTPDFVRNSKAKENIVFDHHHDGINKLKAESSGFISEKSVLDPAKSGCGIVWDAIHPGEPLPEFYKYIQDRDLFKFEFPESRYLGYALPAGTLENIDLFKKLIADPSELEKYIFAGKLISDKIESIIKGLAKSVRIGTFIIEDHTYNVGVIQLDGSTGIISEMGRYVVDNGMADICVMWSPCEVGYNYSIRAKYGLDCPQISHTIRNKSPNSAKFRSGGSKDAAGATSDQLPEEIFNF